MVGHYFDEQPEVASDPVDVDVVLPDLAFTITTDRGVFGRGQLDRGTALLLRSTDPLPTTGHLLDLGCGAGPIAIAAAKRAPGMTVWAVDVNTRARQLTAANATRNRCSNVRVAAPDEVPADLDFDRIWSNPPIRVGKSALHDLLDTWFARLTTDGTSTIVVQRHLGADSLQRWLTERGWPTDRVASRAGYRVLRSHRAADQRVNMLPA